MERRKSSLNPDAAPYIPIAKQRETELTKKLSHESKESLKSGTDETARRFSITEGHRGSGKSGQADGSDSTVQGTAGHIFDSEVTREQQNLIDQMEELHGVERIRTDLDRLAFLFPDIPSHSLGKAYCVTGGVVDESIRMLKYLKAQSDLIFDLPRNLPGSSSGASDDSTQS